MGEEHPEHTPSTQAAVRETMLRAGGYWRPLAAVARILEELGELYELLAKVGPAEEEELAFELADLWIITTALADQFLGDVAEPRTQVRAGLKSAQAAGAAIVAAGEIARVVNYYDGPKTPRSPEEMPSLKETVPRFHDALGALAGALGIDLAKAVAEKIEVIHGRDMARFERDDSDPSTAACLEQFRESQGETLRLWGAPTWNSGSIEDIAVAILPSLRSFAKAAVAESLDGYVIAGPGVERRAPGEAAAALAAGDLSGITAGDSELEDTSRDPAAAPNMEDTSREHAGDSNVQDTSREHAGDSNVQDTSREHAGDSNVQDTSRDPAEDPASHDRLSGTTAGSTVHETPSNPTANPTVSDTPKPYWLGALLSSLAAGVGAGARLDVAETQIEINGLALDVRVLPEGFVLLARR